MTTNLKAILSAVGVAALVTSPVFAKTHHNQQAAPSSINVPADAQASVRSNAPAVTVYSPDVKVQAHTIDSLNPDFQLGAEK